MKISKKNRITHLQKALLISIFIELILILLLFKIGFKQKPKEETYAVEFIDDNFNFDELKPEKPIELPDVKKYISKSYKTNTASNVLQEDKSFEEFRKQQEEAIKSFQKSREELKIASEQSSKKKKHKKHINKKDIRYTGRSNIQYFIKNRKDIFIENPLYTCPDYMKGLIVIDIEVDRGGNVVKAEFNKEKSTTNFQCLIDEAIVAAKSSFFNAKSIAPVLQKGYITYNFY